MIQPENRTNISDNKSLYNLNMECLEVLLDPSEPVMKRNNLKAYPKDIIDLGKDLLGKLEIQPEVHPYRNNHSLVFIYDNLDNGTALDIMISNPNTMRVRFYWENATKSEIFIMDLSTDSINSVVHDFYTFTDKEILDKYIDKEEKSYCIVLRDNTTRNIHRYITKGTNVENARAEAFKQADKDGLNDYSYVRGFPKSPKTDFPEITFDNNNIKIDFGNLEECIQEKFDIIAERFIKYAKEEFGYDITIRETKHSEGDTFEKLFGGSFKE